MDSSASSVTASEQLYLCTSIYLSISISIFDFIDINYNAGNSYVIYECAPHYDMNHVMNTYMCGGG